MTIVAVQIKVMPESIETNLKELELEITKALEKEGAKIQNSKQEPVAFGLKAVIITLAWPEEKDTSIIENIKVPGLNSIQILDYRRAFG